MSNLPAMATGIGGFFAGLFWIQFFGRAARLFLAPRGKSPVANVPFMPQRSRWAVPLLLRNPAPWSLLLILWLSYAAMAGRVASIWGWFVGGFFLSAVMIYTISFTVLLRAKKMHSRSHGA